MSRILVLVAPLLLVLVGCRKDPLHTPTCRDPEKGVCSAEELALTPADLLRPGEEPSWMVQEDIHASCVLQESGRLEKCRVERGTEALRARIVEVLARRRYVPVRYRGEAISVSYDFKLRLLPIGKRATEARAAVFGWAADELAPGTDGEVGTICFASETAADPTPEELAVLRDRRAALPFSSCEGRQGVSVVQLREFQLWGDKGDGEVSVSVAGAGGESVRFAAERADGGWKFAATKRYEFEE